MLGSNIRALDTGRFNTRTHTPSITQVPTSPIKQNIASDCKAQLLKCFHVAFMDSFFHRRVRRRLGKAEVADPAPLVIDLLQQTPLHLFLLLLAPDERRNVA